MKLFFLLFTASVTASAAVKVAIPEGSTTRQQQQDAPHPPRELQPTSESDATNFLADLIGALFPGVDPDEVLGLYTEEESVSDVPSMTPSSSPVQSPTVAVPVLSDVPSLTPSSSPEESEEGVALSDVPSLTPSSSPVAVPTEPPVSPPVAAPTSSNVTTSDVPSLSPSDQPSLAPSDRPSLATSDVPSLLPSDQPSLAPSDISVLTTSDVPSLLPSDQPSLAPSDMPSLLPSDIPSFQPSDYPSLAPAAWDEDSALDPNDTHFCHTTAGSEHVDAPTMEILYSYRLELTEDGEPLFPVTSAIEGRLQEYLSTGDGSVCDSSDEQLEGVVGITATPLDVPAALCGIMAATVGTGTCTFVAGRTTVAVTTDTFGDAAAEASIYCRTLDSIRGFLDSGIIEEEMDEVAEVRSTILGGLVPAFCTVQGDDGDTISTDKDLITEEGEEEEDGEDQGNAVIPASEKELKSPGDEGPSKALVIPLTVVLGAGLAALLALVIYKRRRYARQGEEPRTSDEDGMGQDRYVDSQASSLGEGGTDAEVWPPTPESGALYSITMSEVDGMSQSMTATPTSTAAGNDASTGEEERSQ